MIYIQFEAFKRMDSALQEWNMIHEAYNNVCESLDLHLESDGGSGRMISRHPHCWEAYIVTFPREE